MVLALVLLAAKTLELHGRVDPPPGRAFLVLNGTTSPFFASVLAGPDGRFRFRNLRPGTYALSVLVPGRGEVWRTVHVNESSADARGRINILVSFTPADSTLAAGQTVSLNELRIPDKAISHYLRAQESLSRYDAETAVKHLKQAVTIAPQFAAAWNQLGTIAYQSGQRQEAEKYFRTALEHEPGAYSPLVNLGGVLVNLGRWEEAWEINSRAVRRQPEDALARVQLGAACWALGKIEEAIVHLREAKRLDPDHFAQPQLLLANIYLERGDWVAAARELDELLARRPDSPEVRRLKEKIERLRPRR